MDKFCFIRITVIVTKKYSIIFFLFYSVEIGTQDGTILVDYSKNIITEETMKHLMNLVCLRNEDV